MKNIKFIYFSTLCLFLSQVLIMKAQNYVQILPTDSPSDIIKKAAQTTPSVRQLRWQELELTAFFHFGINTYTDREWGHGHEDEKLFNPTQFDADQWVSVCKQAGIKQVILTAKHHDGFCLWQSAYTDHSVKHSPWKDGKGDVMKEVSEACKKHKIGFGVYLSPWDRTESSYGTDAYNDFFINQLTELLTKYGQIDEVWFDGANGEGPNGKRQVYDFERYYKLIRQLQPQATIAIMGPDVRWVGTESGYGRETEWSVMPIDARLQESIAKNSQSDATFAPMGDMTDSDLASRSKIIGAKGLIWYPSETDVSIRPGWFYHEAEDNRVKTPEKLFDIYFSSVGRNSVLLLNLPPDKRGLIHENDVKNLLAWRKLIDETFKTNMAKGAKIVSKNGLNSTLILDGKNNTHFTTKGQDTTTTIELNLNGMKTFDVLLLQENIRIGQRIESFKLEYWDKNAWKEVITGTTVGYKRLMRFDAITTNKVRLHILSSRLNPTIAELGLYKLPPSVLYKANTLEKMRKSPKNHKAVGKPAQLKTSPDPKYNKGGDKAWQNGTFGSNTAFNDGEWLGWNGQNFEGTIDFQKSEPIKKVSIDFFNLTQSWIFMPSEVILLASDDGINFKEIEKQSNFGIAEEGVRRVNFKVNIQAKFLKIVAKNYGSIPKGYEGFGSPTWLFVDEVVVE
ncbi:MAG: alpha-L-fucosidase [Saprospiraceae bacterium]|nr:alpha-L-fucosidase [Saprospiraceae bacterium]